MPCVSWAASGGCRLRGKSEPRGRACALSCLRALLAAPCAMARGGPAGPSCLGRAGSALRDVAHGETGGAFLPFGLTGVALRFVALGEPAGPSYLGLAAGTLRTVAHGGASRAFVPFGLHGGASRVVALGGAGGPFCLPGPDGCCRAGSRNRAAGLVPRIFGSWEIGAGGAWGAAAVEGAIEP